MTGRRDHRRVGEEYKETVTDSREEKPVLVSCASTEEVTTFSGNKVACIHNQN